VLDSTLLVLALMMPLLVLDRLVAALWCCAGCSAASDEVGVQAAASASAVRGRVCCRGDAQTNTCCSHLTTSRSRRAPKTFRLALCSACHTLHAA